MSEREEQSGIGKIQTEAVVSAEFPFGFPGAFDKLGTPYSEQLTDAYKQPRPEPEE